MKEEIDWSSNFLPIKEIYNLIQNFDEGTFIYNDLESYRTGYPYTTPKLIKDSIKLLELLNIIKVSSNSVILNEKFRNIKNLNQFKKHIGYVILDNLFEELSTTINIDDAEYCISCGGYKISRAFTPYNKSGLVNLLLDINLLDSDSNRSMLIITDKFFLEKISHRENCGFSPVNKRVITLQKFKDILAYKEEKGRVAENLAIKFEIKRLKYLDVVKPPLLVSELDISKGYDILSYEGNNSTEYDRFIEVKGIGYKKDFYITRNELSKAKELGSHYYLYLVDIISENIAIIKNPFIEVFLDNTAWFCEPELYRVTEA